MSETNKVVLEGVVTKEPYFLTESYGCKIYELEIAVSRKSEVQDIIVVNAPSYLVEGVGKGQFIRVIGEFRSHNKQIEGTERTKLILTVFAKEIEAATGEEENNIINLEGYLCKEPKYRTTPFNREITDVMLAVHRGNGRSDYIPCIFWGTQAKFVANKCTLGSSIKLTGRIQSREYRKTLEDGVVETHVAYEISVKSFEKLS